MSDENTLVGIYDTHTSAEEAVRELQKSRFDMKRVSIVGKDHHTDEHVVGFYHVGDRMKVWGKQGAFWGGLWALLFGSALFVVPEIGPVMVFGPLVASIIGALEKATGGEGLSALGAGLHGAGVPRDGVRAYEEAIKAAKFVVIAHGTVAEVARAKGILEATGAARVSVY